MCPPGEGSSAPPPRRRGEAAAAAREPLPIAPAEADRQTAAAPADSPEGLTARGVERLRADDRVLYELLQREQRRQRGVLAMIASSSVADPSVLVCAGMATTNVTVEGYPGARLHTGCQVVDSIEELAIERAKRAFGARYANVQPHSGTSANETVLFGLLEPGATILGLELASGGHFTHGAPESVSGRWFRAVGYGVNERGLLDYDRIRQLALEHRPRLVICGASAYPRTIDFARFRAIADEIGAFVLADISHIAGLVAGGQHPSPIDHCHFTTTSTYKQLFGPRGGLILIGRDHDRPAPGGQGTLADLIQRAVFPLFQSTPDLSAIAAKARALALVASPGFRALAERIVLDAQALAGRLLERGFRIVTGGTDNHIVLVDVRASRGIDGALAERALEACDILTNKHCTALDGSRPLGATLLRIGTNTLALRGLGPAEMAECAALIDLVLSAAKPDPLRGFVLAPDVRDRVRFAVADLCARFPIPHYP
jgi:glycine hydroxymethyltransferase